MVLQEAAQRAGVGTAAPLAGRPTRMAVAAALRHGVVPSTGCIGNRVYTDLDDDELYVAMAGASLERITRQLPTIAEANATLAAYHRERRQAPATE